MPVAQRRYDIDWIRVIAIGLLMVYHIGIGFNPWGAFFGFIQSDQSIDWLWPPMSMLNVWRIPLLFFVSGMGVYFAIRQRNWKQLMTERARRILLPLIFGIIFISPFHLMIWQKYYSQDLSYHPQAAHLWFLANIFLYVLLLSPLFFLLKRKELGRLQRKFEFLFSNPIGYILIAALLIIEVSLVNPEHYSLFAGTLHGYLIGFLCFLSGFIMVYSGKSLWPMLRSWSWIFLLVGLGLFLYRWLTQDMESPHFLMAIETCAWVFGVFGLGYRFLNHPSKTLSYLSQAAYPLYIIHMFFQYLGSYLIFPLNLPVGLKLILVVIFTFLTCFGVYELIIRRVFFLRPVFGLKPLKK